MRVQQPEGRPLHHLGKGHAELLLQHMTGQDDAVEPSLLPDKHARRETLALPRELLQSLHQEPLDEGIEAVELRKPTAGTLLDELGKKVIRQHAGRPAGRGLAHIPLKNPAEELCLLRAAEPVGITKKFPIVTLSLQQQSLHLPPLNLNHSEYI